MHPIMPFVTEELWQSLPWKMPANTPARVRDGKPAVMTLMFQSFPRAQDSWINVKAEQTVRQLQNIVEAIRNFRGENNISPKVEFPVRYTTSSAAVPAFLQEHHAELLALCRLQSLDPVSGSTEGQEFQAVIPLSEPQLEFHISLGGLVNVDEEVKRVKKEMERVGADVEFVRAKLAKESFTAKAPPALVEKERAREKELADKLAELSAGLAKLEKLSGGR
jgi:valyl-tRNA synthetase